jgi:biotin carboxylase
MKKLLLIEANGNAGDDLLGAAADLGVQTLVATHEDVYAAYPQAMRDKIDDTVFTDFAVPEVAVKSLVECGRTSGVSGVVTGWEFFSPTVTQVAAELGLPGHDPARSGACRNKKLMAQVLSRAGVPVPHTLVLEPEDDAETLVSHSTLSYPVVVKPAENAGSLGVSVVGRSADLDAAVRLARSWPTEFPHGVPLDPAVLIQEYIGGEEYSVESVVHGGRIHHLTVTQKITTQDAHRAETGHTVPAGLPSDVRTRILATVSSALAALGLRDGLGHTEVKVPRDGQPRIIELGARPPGDHIMKLVKLAFGVDEAKAYLSVAMGDTPELRPTRARAAAIRFITSPREGIFRGLTGLPDGDHVASCEIYLEPGARCGTARDNVGRIGHIIVVADTTDEVNALADAAMAAINVELA